ncbi:MAG: peptide chain release factor-like protein, partial [Fibromonadales bacterium]|nr:peptide chain release factor-like protein [Fibromonadales bacterium]
MQYSRTALLQLSDADLLKLCEASAYKGSGPGGQHRNKTSTGVNLKLEVSNQENPLIKKIVVQTFSCDDRSAHINKLLALKKLRMKIALQMREEPAVQTPFPFPGSNGKISPDNALYPQFIADVLDRLDDFDKAAKMWGLSKSALNKIMLQDKKVMEAFQKHRQCQAEKTRQTACQSTA